MSIVHPIDDICHELGRGEEPNKQEALIKTDGEGNPLSGLSGRLKTKHRFAVRSHYRVEMGVSKLGVKDFKQNASLDVPVRWQAEIDGDGTELIRAAIKSESSILKTVEFTMQSCLQALAESRGANDLGSWVHNDKDRLCAAINSSLIPLQLKAEVVIDSTAMAPRSLTVKTPSFEVKTKNSTRNVGLAIELRIDPKTNIIQAGPKTLGDWDLQLRAWARDHIERNESLNAYYREDEFVNRLCSHIRSKLDNLGWTVDRIFIQRDEVPTETESFFDHLKVEWTSAKGRKFIFQVKVGISIDDIGLYDRRGRPALRGFAQANLDKFFDTVLFKEDTDNLSPDNFNHVKDEVHALVSGEARKNGLIITTLVPDPVIAEWQYLKNRRYTIEARDYPTLDPGTNANFDINVEGRITSIGFAFQANNQSSSIDEQLRDIVVRKVEAFMREVDFDTYINQFAPKPHLGKHIEQEPIKKYLHDTLAASIQQELLSKFSFSATYINIQRHDPDIRGQLDLINNFEPQDFELKIRCENYRDERFLIPLNVRLRFVAPSIEYIAALMSRNLDMPQMVIRVRDKLKNLLDGRSADELAMSTFEDNLALGLELQQELNTYLSNLGMGVVVDSIERGESEAEKIKFQSEQGHLLDEANLCNQDKNAQLEHDRDFRKLNREGDLDYMKALNQKRLEDLKNDKYIDVDEKRNELEHKNSGRLNQSIEEPQQSRNKRKF